MTVGDFLATITNPDRVRIVQQGKDIFVGFLGALMAQPEAYSSIKDRKVIKFRAVPEINHRGWRQFGLARPLEPRETPDFLFRDLEMKLYYTIYI